MKRILVSAYGCEPGRGSEAGVGWNWVLQMARHNKLHVITRRNDREKIERNLPAEVAGNLTFTYYDTPRILQRIKRKEKGLYLYYLLWQIGIVPIVRRLLREDDFDYTMHLTFGSLWMPTFLPFFHTPFIWGPVGGGDGVPRSLLHILPAKQRMVQSLRYVLIATSFMNPLVAIPSRKASVILCRTENNARAIPRKYRNKTKVILETAMDVAAFPRCKGDMSEAEHASDGARRVELFITGRLVPFKNVPMAVEAFDSIAHDHPEAHLTIIGKGPERSRIERYIEDRNLTNRVRMIKEMPRAELLGKLADADVYLLPSLREGGSWSLMEAMSVGLPSVCLDWTGMGMITTDETSIRITPGDYSTTREAFARAMEKLIVDKMLRRRMGLAARRRIEEQFSWDSVSAHMEDVLAELDDERKQTNENPNGHGGN
ncbi:glycosyltransferase family 4 protein [Bifidobacterium miconisargentati]|uniref:glycosyltransferase family 4 protein n=1 Tax=Bifidobacterium miconisargentati TaxID=2834437 RepID=UPI001BDD963C|nr:glycosyltransferase family 4 protein [Bifidobacterium miconisargentati]MBW3090920.1 glycosyltransferase family 4 protein [Bifidobacterium miconisargentati]